MNTSDVQKNCKLIDSLELFQAMTNCKFKVLYENYITLMSIALLVFVASVSHRAVPKSSRGQMLQMWKSNHFSRVCRQKHEVNEICEDSVSCSEAVKDLSIRGSL